MPGQALIAPFDTLVHHRPRVLQLFDVHYRIEIYTPAPKRKFGYYVWPFLLDGRLVVEDVKSKATAGAAAYRIKRHLMLSVHGIEVKEVM